MTKLSVNVNKIATLRNARGGNSPHLCQTTQKIIEFGAQGITVHPRPDERHIKKQDVYDLKEVIKAHNQSAPAKIEFNIEGYPSSEFLGILFAIQPDQCTLVPDPPDVITSNAGWDCVKNKDLLISVIQKIRSHQIRTSLFIDPRDLDEEQLMALKEIAPDRCELYTEEYARSYGTPQQESITQKYVLAAQRINELSIELNAGHDLTQKNLKFLVQKIPTLKEVSIGHALVCESLYEGLETTIKNYLKELK